MMVLYTTLYDSPNSLRVDSCTRALMLPMDVLVNTLLGSLKMTTKETAARVGQPCYERYVILSFLLPTLLLLIVLYMPIFGVSFLVWSTIQGSRHPYRCDVNPSVPYKYDASHADLDLVIVTSDTALLPEYLARRVNVSHTQTRARKMGALFSEHGFEDNRNMVAELGLGKPSSPHTMPGAGQGRLPNYGSNISSYTLPGSVTTMFPSDVDFLCLQGVFDERAQSQLAKFLRRRYPHVISDVTVNSWHTNFYRRGSGLVTASRYRILDADFLCFRQSIDEDVNTAKGVLYAKVLLGEDAAGRQLVGVISNLHLQKDGGQDAISVRSQQLADLHQWIQEKIRCSQNSDSSSRQEIVVFDILCGNFEFDNMTTAEKENWQHPAVVAYTDICRIEPGLDHEWAPGTKLVGRMLYWTAIRSPSAMKSTFDTAKGRAEYMEGSWVDEEPSEGAAVLGSEPGRRRMCRILYRSVGGDRARRKLSLENIRVVTQLATLTNHLPLTGHFRVAPVGQPPGGVSPVHKDMFILRNEHVT